MPIWAIVLDVLLMLGLAYAAAASFATGLLGLGFSGSTGKTAPAIFIAAIVSFMLLLYHPMAIAYLLGAIPLPDWSHG